MYSFPINGWPLGIDNIQPDYAVEPGALRDAVNVDIFDSGKIRRRRGNVLRSALVGSHSLWSHPRLNKAYYVAGTTLYELSHTLTSAAVVTGLMAGAAVAYLYVNGEVFWSNGITGGRILSGVNSPWGIETPSSEPNLTATTGGLPAGTYQVVTTFRNLAGEESGAQNSQSITLAATGGISLTNMPVASSGAVTHRNIYMTLQNSDVLYRILTLPVSTTSTTIGTLPTPSSVLKTQDYAPMPPGTILAYRNGQIFVASGNYIYYSEPMRYGLYNPIQNFYIYPEPVTVMLAVPEGLHVCADRSYFMENPGTNDVVQRETLPYGGIRGTGIYFPNGTDVAWFSPRGQVRATGGQVTPVTEKRHAPGMMSSGHAFIREQEGLKQVITVVQQNATNPLIYTGA